MGKRRARFRFGAGVKQLRKKYGWTQGKLANRAGLSKRYLQKIESKNSPDVSIDTISKIAKAFNEGVPDLLDLII